jgi:hypothetical protein
LAEPSLWNDMSLRSERDRHDGGGQRMSPLPTNERVSPSPTNNLPPSPPIPRIRVVWIPFTVEWIHPTSLNLVDVDHPWQVIPRCRTMDAIPAKGGSLVFVSQTVIVAREESSVSFPPGPS